MNHTAYIALGSNLQQPAEQIRRALHAIAQLPQTQLLKTSSLYVTAPVGYDNQPDFINAVASVSTALTPLALLHALLQIEQTHGRERPFANAPRVLDLDVLLYDTLAITSPELTIPHPRMLQRAFVMVPLAEIAPQLSLGAHGTVAQIAAACDNQGIQRLT